MDAITGLSDYITNVDLVDYMWFKNFSDNSYTLCYLLLFLLLLLNRNKFNPSRLPSGWSDTLLATPSTLPSHTAVGC